MKLEFLDSLSKNTAITDFIKIRPVGAELFLRTDRHDEAKSHFRKFANALKIGWISNLETTLSVCNPWRRMGEVEV